MSRLNKAFVILGGIGIAFLFLPIFHIFLNLSFQSLLNTIKDPEVINAIFTSLKAAFFAVLLSFALGVPIGFLIAKTEFPFKKFLETCINLPIAIPHVAAGIALLSLFNSKTLVGRLFQFFHIGFVDTIYGVIIAMMFVSFSFVVSASIVGFSSVDEDLELVARSLGASPGYTFFKVTLPLAFPSIIRGCILAFARSLSEVGALLIIAYYPKTAQILVYERFEEYGLNAARPITAVVIVASLFIFLTLLYLNYKFFQKRTDVKG
ncbi:MAG: ABC transporter permease [Thermodesulfobacteria bacterium]|nr:ABC transporter permease [Thermodesulfobacteriota bacterium]